MIKMKLQMITELFNRLNSRLNSEVKADGSWGTWLKYYKY